MGFLQRFFDLDTYTILARIVVMLLILPLHEFAHGWMARRFGDDTAYASGRITLNPIAHLDPFGSVLLLLTGFGWAKPVPINPSRMRNPRSGLIWTSLAGPLSNLLAAIVGALLLQISWGAYRVYGGEVLSGVVSFFMYFVIINISLAIFNLVPVPPLDGSKVLMGLLPYRQSMWLQMHQQILSIVLLVLVFFGALSGPISWLSGHTLNGLLRSTDWLANLVTRLLV